MLAVCAGIARRASPCSSAAGSFSGSRWELLRLVDARQSPVELRFARLGVGQEHTGPAGTRRRLLQAPPYPDARRSLRRHRSTILSESMPPHRRLALLAGLSARRTIAAVTRRGCRLPASSESPFGPVLGLSSTSSAPIASTTRLAPSGDLPVPLMSPTRTVERDDVLLHLDRLLRLAMPRLSRYGLMQALPRPAQRAPERDHRQQDAFPPCHSRLWLGVS